MTLTRRFLRFVVLSVLLQTMLIGGWYLFSTSSQDERQLKLLVDKIGEIDSKLLEGVIFQQMNGNTLARDLLIYQLLEANNLEAAEFQATLPAASPDQLCRPAPPLKLVCANKRNGKLTGYLPLVYQQKNHGFIRLTKGFEALGFTEDRLITAVVAMFVSIFFTLAGILFFTRNCLAQDLKKLLSGIETLTHDPSIKTTEYQRILEKFLQTIKLLHELEHEKRHYERRGALFQLSREVAHDLQSPLKALEYSLNNTSGSEHSLSALARIKAITQDLLRRNSEVPPTTLGQAITQVLTEKKMEYADQLKWLHFSYQDSKNIASEITVTAQFLRVLSNIINNSIEARKPRALLELKIILRDIGPNWILEVSDNGAGIDQESLAQIKQGGVSIGKVNGMGLGITSVINFTKNNGGTFEINSTQGLGTTVTLTLPKLTADKPQLPFSTSASIYAADDNPAVLFFWRSIFGEKVHCFQSVTELLRSLPTGRCLVLCDHDFGMDEADGLYAYTEIQKKFPEAEFWLVTASPAEHFQHIAGLNLCDKSRIAGLPTKHCHHSEWVLLDDEPLIHRIWALQAEQRRITLHSCYERNDLEKILPNISADVPIFLDQHLGNRDRGEDIAMELREKGFEYLYLVSGDRELRCQTPVIRGQLDKNFPLQTS